MDKIVPYLHTIPHVGAPLSVQINATNRCYSKCVMCMKWQDWPKEDFLTTGKLLDLFKSFSDMGVQSVLLSGGEPFIRDDLLEILMGKRKLKVGILTSGLWSEKSRRNFAEIIRRLDLIHFSLDSVRPPTYSLIRGTSEDACEVVKGNIIWAKNLIDSGLSSAKIKVNIVKHKLNASEVHEIAAFCEAHGIPYRVSQVHTFDELRAENSFPTIPKCCVVPYYHCVVDADGEVFLCCHLLNDNDNYSKRNASLSIGNVLDEDFEKIWHGEKAEKMREKLMSGYKFPECSRCDNRYIHINQAFEEYSQKLSEPVFL